MSNKDNHSTSQKHCYDYPRPAVTVDIALLCKTATDDVEVLLIRRGRNPFRGRWALPGGFVDEDEPLEHAARRELEEETGIRTTVTLKQIGAFGDPGRDPRGHTVSIVFAGWLDQRMPAKAADDAATADWHPASRLPDLAFDHESIMAAVLQTMLQ